MEKPNSVTIKGTREGVMVQVSPEPQYQVKELLTHLQEKIHEDSSFFKNAELVLDLGMRPFQENEFRSLRALLDSSGVRLKGILSDNPITKLLAKGEGITLLGDRSIMNSRVRVDHPVKTQRLKAQEENKPVSRPEKRPLHKLPALFVRKTLRNGQKVHFAGDITIVGDVNPGAEVLASGNIAVFGALRGVAHAGAEGERTAVVIALALNPTQLRIADCIARAPEKHAGNPGFPELARITDSAIMVEPYKSQKIC